MGPGLGLQNADSKKNSTTSQPAPEDSRIFLFLAGEAGMDNEMETTIFGDYHKDPFLHSLLTGGKAQAGKCQKGIALIGEFNVGMGTVGA